MRITTKLTFLSLFKLMNIEVVEVKDTLPSNDKIKLNTSKLGGSSVDNPSVNFGIGVEMLMNEKKKTSTPKSGDRTSRDGKIQLNSLDSLEK